MPVNFRQECGWTDWVAHISDGRLAEAAILLNTEHSQHPERKECLMIEATDGALVAVQAQLYERKDRQIV